VTPERTPRAVTPERTPPAPLPLPRLVLVAESSATAGRPLTEIVGEAVAAGVRAVWLRDKRASKHRRRELARFLAKLLQGEGGVLIASPGPGAELADMVQLGRADPRPSGRVVGRSCHSRAELEQAAGEGCSWATLSPIFPSTSKPCYGPPLGTAALHGSPLPTWALGGVGASNAWACLEAGAAGVVVMGAVLSAPEPGRAARAILANLEGVLV
jgi:thiamine monophosphate synthase